ncbi:MAG: glycoside hydrolase family 19 protein [Acidithiobacillus sp.]
MTPRNNGEIRKTREEKAPRGTCGTFYSPAQAITSSDQSFLKAAYENAPTTTLTVFKTELDNALKNSKLSTDINSKNKLAHFLAQTGHETGGGKNFIEDLHYQTETAVAKFSYFRKNKHEAYTYGKVTKQFIDFLNKNPKEAAKYGKTPIISYSEVHGANPEAIANRAYSNRDGNGDVASGNGWRYRGRGMMQTTSKNNYRSASANVLTLFGEQVDFVNNPDLVAEPLYAMKTALIYWHVNHIGNTVDTIVKRKADVSAVTRAVTKKINPPLDGFEKRLNRAKRFLALPFFKECLETAQNTITLISFFLRGLA